VSDGDPKEARDPGALSQLLEELAAVPRADVPDEYLTGLRPGTEVGRFIVEREIGRGGFGVVYAALDPELGRTVALKLLKPGSGLATKDGLWLRREAEAVARLNHAGIVTLHDFGKAPAGAFLVFELLRGETLSRRIARGPVPLDEALPLARAVIEALAHAHASNVLHRDLKPGNIYLCEGGAVKVLDFGIAHLFGQEGPTSGGTPAYMAPEQWNEGAVDARADLFAFGVLLLELLTGQLPFGRGGARGAAIDTALAEVLPKTGAPRQLRALIRALVQADPAARPAAARTVADELAAIEAARHEGRRPWRLVALASMVVALGAGAAAWLLPAREAPAGEVVSVAVADAENGTGDPDLDRMGDLARVAFGESRRLRVLSRERLLAAGRGSEAGAAARIDRRAGRVLAQLAGASVLLVPSVERRGAALRITLTAEPPEGGAPLFTARAEAAGPAGVAGAVDEVVGEARRRLRERGADLEASPSRLAAMTTASLPAYRDYVEGLDCASRPTEAVTSESSRCVDAFRRALGHDPGFALAHFQLAIQLDAMGAPPNETASHMEAALRAVDRLSRRDAALVKAQASHAAGRDEEALAAYEAVLAEHPDDLQVLNLAGELLFHADKWAGAAPYMERILKLDPEAYWALDHLVECHAALGRLADLRRLAGELAAHPATPESLRVLVRAHVYLGEPEAALARARQAVETGGGDRAAREDLAALLGLTLDPAGAEQVARALAAERPDDAWLQVSPLSRMVAQGRLAEARAGLASLAPELTRLGPTLLPNARSGLFALDPAYRHLADDAERMARVAAEKASIAVVLATLFGDLAVARRLVPLLPAGSPGTELAAALLAWRDGDAAGALARLAKLEQRLPWSPSLVLPAYAVLEVAAATGGHAEAAAAGERVRRTWPRGSYWSFARARATFLEARARAALGQVDEARTLLDRLIVSLRRADPDFALAREARALRARLGPHPAPRSERARASAP
jgi:tetratricopeptide (TPR) repeat protein